MKHDDFIRESLDQNLSGLHVSRQQQTAIFEEIVGGKKMKKKIPFSLALVAVLILTSVVALAVGTNAFNYFSNRDARYGKLADQAANVTAAPADIESDELGSVNARIDSAYYDGQSLSVGFIIENSTRIEPYTPSAEELANAELIADPIMPLARNEADQQILEEFQTAVENGTPYGYAIYSVYASDHTLVNGIDMPPYTADEDYDDTGAYIAIRNFESPLPEELQDLANVDVSIQLYEHMSIHYFDGTDMYHYGIAAVDSGTITAVVPKSDADTHFYTGSAEIDGITFSAEARLSAMNGNITLTADRDVFNLVSYEVNGDTWQAPAWNLVVVDETGYEYRNMDGYSLTPAQSLDITVEGKGELPAELHIYLLHAGEDPDTYDYWPVAADKLDNPHIVLTIAE